MVVDLSLLAEAETAGYVAELTHVLERHRRRTGLPHWIVVDEAHQPLGRAGQAFVRSGSTGYCLATYLPEMLAPGTVRAMEWQVIAAGPPPGEAVLGAGDRTDLPLLFTVTARTTEHVRHQHKYTDTDLPRQRGFHFRRDDGPTGVVALNLRQFLDHVAVCDPAELRHHAACRDMSRWIRDVHRDPPLADHLRRLEGRIAAGADLDRTRVLVVDAVRNRYGIRPLTDPGPDPGRPASPSRDFGPWVARRRPVSVTADLDASSRRRM
ncbi:hypothetical protein GCM10029964_056420 [Kibdelosporangium lantanae]